MIVLEIVGFIVCSIFFLKKSDQDIRYIMIYLLVVSILFSRLLRDFSIGNVTLAGVYALLIVCSYLLLSVFKRPKLKLSKNDFVIIIFISWCLVSFIISIYHNNVASALVDFSWFFWFCGILYLILLRSNGDDIFEPITNVIYVSGIVLTLIGLFRFLFGQGMVNTTGDVFYIQGSKSVIVGLAFTIVFYRNKLKYRRALLLLLFVGLILSLKRQVYLGLIVALFFNFAFFKEEIDLKKTLKLAIVLGISISALIGLNLFNVGPLEALLDRFGRGNIQSMFTDPAVMYRLAAYEMAVTKIISSPLLGEGWGSNFEFQLILEDEIQFFNHSPHNTFLWMSYKGGIPLLILYFYLILYPFYKLNKIKDKIVDKKKYKTVFGMLILITIGSQFWDYHSVMFLSVPFWFIWALTYKTVTCVNAKKLILCKL